MYNPYPGNGEQAQLSRCPKCYQHADVTSEAAMRRLYGGQDYAGNFHYTCFTREMLKKVAADSGLKFVEELDFEHQWDNWNFKLLFQKGDIW